AVKTDAGGYARLSITIDDERTKTAKTAAQAEKSHDDLDRYAREIEAEERAVAEPAGGLVETGDGTRSLNTEPEKPSVANVAAGAGIGSAAIRLTTSGRRLRVAVKVIRLARVAQVAGVAGAPASGGISLGVSLASTILLFAIEHEVEERMSSVDLKIEPPGDCSDARHSELHRDQGTRCKGPQRSCRQDKVKRGDCAELRQRVARNKSCRDAQRLIMNECFRGGDDEHRKYLGETIELLNSCESRLRNECP
ncbi:MAG: hypothetical protein SF051_06210, partial [Elusimicrobiota bacterium]|nr:hypothetical protein [Elusimicrobiota bacterium]